MGCLPAFNLLQQNKFEKGGSGKGFFYLASCAILLASNCSFWVQGD